MDTCDHVGFHSGRGCYDPATGRLRYVIVCDACESVIRELESITYRPQFEPDLPPLAA
jgi:hypothetical protein